MPQTRQGDLEFSVGMDDKEAKKKLDALEKDIEKVNKAIEKTGNEKTAISADLDEARVSAEKARKEIERLNKEKALLAELAEKEALYQEKDTTQTAYYEEYYARDKKRRDIYEQIKEAHRIATNPTEADIADKADIRAQESLPRLRKQFAEADRQAERTKAKIHELQLAMNAASAEAAGIREQLGLAADVNVDSAIKKNASDILSAEKNATKLDERVAQLEQDEQRVTDQLTAQNELRDKLMGQAGEEERKARERAAAAEQEAQAQARLKSMQDAMQSVNNSISSGFKGILKWGFGIRSLFILFRKLRNFIKEAVSAFAEQDAETKATLDSLKSRLSDLKLAWGAAFAPVVKAVAPILDKLISKLIEAANAVSMFVAILTGQSTYKKAVQNQNNLTDSLNDTANAAKNAKRQLSGLDEMNIWQPQGGGGGGGSGGGGSGISWVDTELPQWAQTAQGFLDSFKITVGDVLFDWGDLTGEQIAEKVIAGLGLLTGASIGFLLGGPVGAVVGSLIGVTLSIALGSLLFNHDGELSQEEKDKFVDVLTKWLGIPIALATGGNLSFVFSIPAIIKWIFGGDGGGSEFEEGDEFSGRSGSFEVEAEVSLVKKGWDTVKGWIEDPNQFAIDAAKGIGAGISLVKKGWTKVLDWFISVLSSDEKNSDGTVKGPDAKIGRKKGWSTSFKAWILGMVGAAAVGTVAGPDAKIGRVQGWTTTFKDWILKLAGRTKTVEGPDAKIGRTKGWTTTFKEWILKLGNRTAQGTVVGPDAKIGRTKGWTTTFKDWLSGGDGTVKGPDAVIGRVKGWLTSFVEWLGGKEGKVDGPDAEVGLTKKDGNAKDGGWNTFSTIAGWILSVVTAGAIPVDVTLVQKGWTTVKDWVMKLFGFSSNGIELGGGDVKAIYGSTGNSINAMPAMAGGAIVPPLIMTRFEGSYSIDDIVSRLDRLLSVERPINISTTVSAKCDKRVLFTSVVEQATTVKRSTGKNPFDI